MTRALFFVFLLVLAGLAFAIDDGITERLTVPAGSYIIDVDGSGSGGSVAQPAGLTIANGIKPYGLIHALVVNHKVPVQWVIEPSKVRDGVDITIAGKNYRGGPFVIPAIFATPTVVNTINTWRAKGVIVDGPIASSVSNVPVYDELTSFPNAVLDTSSGSIVAAYYTNAEVPTSTYRIAGPGAITACDDLFVLPHADPVWEASDPTQSFKVVLPFVRGGGYLWSACHAVSVLENIDDPTDADTLPDLNFNSDVRLLHYKNDGHAAPTVPYSYDPSSAGHPIMQFIGKIDTATNNGSEQVYLPDTNGWRSTTTVSVYDPDHADVVSGRSPGRAAILAYGRAFGNPNYGMVMYEAGHSHNKGDLPDLVAAQQAYFNFLLLAGIDRRPEVDTATFPTNIDAGSTTTFNASVTGGAGGNTYEWTSSCGGTFSDPFSATPNFTAPLTSKDLQCVIRLTIADLCTRRNFEAAVIIVNGLPELGITKTASQDPVPTNGAFSYNLDVVNNGANATNVTITDTLPSGVTYSSFTDVSGSGWTCSNSSGTVTCQLPSLLSGASSRVRLNVTAPGTQTSFTNTATVSAAEGDFLPDNNRSSVTTLVRPASDLAITKSVSPSTVATGNNLTYTLNVTNNGPNGATDVVVTDPLPTNVSYVSAGGTGWSCTYDAGPRTVFCVLPSLASGASAAPLTIRVTAVNPGTFTNTAQVASESVADTNVANNSGSVNATIQASADLVVYKTTSRTDASNGNTLTFTLTVLNRGPDTARNVVLSDVLIANFFTYNGSPTVPPTSAPAVGSSGTLTWSHTTVTALQNLASGSSFTVTFSVRKQGDEIETNTATVTSATNDPVSSNNSDTISVGRLIDGADLAVTKSGPSSVTASGNYSYTIGVRNNGPANLPLGTSPNFNFITVTDTLPEGVAYRGFAQLTTPTSNTRAGTWSCTFDAATRTVTCRYTFSQSFDSGRSTFDLRLDVTAPPTAGSITNTARVSYDIAGFVDNTHSNNASSASTSILPLNTNIEVQKTVNNPTPNLGDTVRFVVTVINRGPNPATSVQIEDPLPAGLSLVQRTLSQGSFASGTWLVGSLGVNASATLTIDARVNVLSPVTNTAFLKALDQADTNSADNTALATVDVPDADLRVTKSIDNATPVLGEFVTFTIDVANLGPLGTGGIVVQDQIVPGVEFTDPATNLSASQGTTTYDSTTGLIRWNVGSLAVGASARLTIRAQVVVPGPLSNTANITASDLADQNTLSNTSTVQFDVLAADLVVSKTSTLIDNGGRVGAPDPGDRIDFTVTVTNNGPTDAADVALIDLLPAGLGYVSHSVTAGSYNPTDGRWLVGNLAAGTTETLTLTTSIDAFGTLVNTASVSNSRPPDPNQTNNTASVSIESGGTADLYITKGVSDPEPYIGDSVIYTVTIINEGPDPASSVVVRDELPAGVSYISSTAQQGSYDPNTGLWNVGFIPVGGSIDLSITVRVDVEGLIINRASVESADQGDPDLVSNSVEVSLNSRLEADLALTKTATPTEVVEGDLVTYTLALNNLGPGFAIDIRVQDNLPSGVSFQSATASLGAYDGATGIWSIPMLLVNETATLEIVTRADGPFPSTNTALIGELTNTAQITASSKRDPNIANNSSTATVSVFAEADLAVTKDAAPEPAIAGDLLTYTLGVSNLGPSTAPSVQLTDPLPAGVAFVSCAIASGPTGDCVEASGTVTASFATLASGSSASVTVVVRLASTLAEGATLGNTVTATTSIPDPVPSNNTAGVTSTVARQADLSVTKQVDMSVPIRGDQVRYTFTVANAGPSDAAGISIADALPSAVTFVSSTGCAESAEGGVPTCTLGAITAGSFVSFSIEARVNDDAPLGATVTNTASVSTSDAPDPVATNDTGSATFTVSGLQLTKSACNLSTSTCTSPTDFTQTELIGEPGETVVYRIRYENFGGPIFDVVMQDQLPAQATLLPDPYVGGTEVELVCPNGDIVYLAQTSDSLVSVDLVLACTLDTATDSAGDVREALLPGQSGTFTFQAIID